MAPIDFDGDEIKTWPIISKGIELPCRRNLDLFTYYDELISRTGDSTPTVCEPSYTDFDNMLLKRLSSRGVLHTRMHGAGVYWDLIPYIKKMVEFDMREDVVVEEEESGVRRRLRRGGRVQERRKHFAGIIDFEELKECWGY
jgi:hypothetical protein